MSGLSGPGLVLQDNGGDTLTVAADSAFTFATPIANGGSYSVSVLTQPPARSCTVDGASGNVAGADVTGVAVSCVLAAPPAPGVSFTFGMKELRFTWSAVTGADFYRVSENPDGVSGYAQVASNLTALAYNYPIPVHLRGHASYIVDACNAAGCTPSSPQVVGNGLVQAIGYFKASNARADAGYGAVALSKDGNTLAVGAPGDTSNATGIDGNQADTSIRFAGAVYVYTRGVSGWSQQAYVKASNTGMQPQGAQFGSSVALSEDGNTLAVGAVDESSNAAGVGGDQGNTLANLSGAVYVFVRSAGVWSQQAYVKASNTGAIDHFGSPLALSLDGNTLAVGAATESSNATGIDGDQGNDLAHFAGAVYVFVRSAGVWSQQAYVKASNTEALDQFGHSVALSGNGDTLAVGAIEEASNAKGINGDQGNNLAPFAGAVYVYTRSAGVWSQQAYVKGSTTKDHDEFGWSVAFSTDGDTLAAGSFQSGTVYMFVRSAGVWSEQAALKPTNTGTFAGFGYTVALSADGNMLAGGAVSDSSKAIGIDGNQVDASVSSSGAVYVYTRSAGVWSQRAYVKASNTRAFDDFGGSIALSGDGTTLAVGAGGEDSGATGIGGDQTDRFSPNAGAVYLY